MPHFNFVTKAILVSIILLMTIIGGLSIWLSQKPFNLQAFKPRIEAAINNASEDVKVEIGSIHLSWPAINEPILFDMKMVKVSQTGQQTPFESTIEKVKIGLSTRHLLIGKVLPDIIIIEDPILQLTQRDGEYDFVIQGIEGGSSNIVEPEEKPRSTQPILDQIFADNRDDLMILSALDQVELRRIVIKSADISTSGTDYLALADLSLTKNNFGLNGELEVTLPGDEGRNAILKSDVVVRRAEGDITLTSTVQDLNPAQLSPYFPNLDILKGQDLLIGGNVKAAFDHQFQLQNALIDFNIPEGTITVPGVYDEGLNLKEIEFDAAFDRAQSKLDITKFKANVANIPLEVTGTSFANGQNIKLPLMVSVAQAQMSDVSAIFPKSHIESSAGQWLTQRLRDGTLNNLQLTTDFHLLWDEEGQSYDGTMTNVRAQFDAENMTIQYSDTLKPVTEAEASGVFENDTLEITGERGLIGDVVGTDISVKLTNLSVAGGGMAYVSLTGNGPFRSVLDYVGDEPIAANDLGFDPKTVEGNIQFDLDLEFPTLKDLPKEQVIVKIDGTLTDVLIPNVVRGLPLSGGPYSLKFADGLIGLTGKGKLAGRNIDLSWEEYFDATGKDFSSKITAKLVADEGLRQAFNIGLEEYVSGPIPVNVTYIDRGVPATIDVKGNLTPAQLHIDAFDYKKPAGDVGDISLRVHMQGEDLKEIDRLQLNAEGFALADGRLIFRKLSDGSDDVARGSIKQATLGKTRLAVDFEITPQNLLKIIAKGPTLELKPFVTPSEDETNAAAQGQQWDNPATQTQEAERPMQISVEADQLLAEKGQVLTTTKLYFETDTQGDVTRAEIDANVGQGNMFLRFRPDDNTGKRTFRLESTDAGAMLRAFGLYDKINGGQLVIYGEPRQGDNQGDLLGKAQINNFSVGDAPLLAKLLGAMSQSGVQNALQNNDLSFAKLESDFEWQFRDGANLLVMKEGRTSGSSLGLTFEGVYNQGRSNIDISGTVIPLSGVNKAVSGIPVIGQILTGGTALLAATYTIKGPSSDPTVSINPLSVLAPGFLRRILFEESVESKVQKAQ